LLLALLKGELRKRRRREDEREEEAHDEGES
jgi:hypothetical protein